MKIKEISLDGWRITHKGSFKKGDYVISNHVDNSYYPTTLESFRIQNVKGGKAIFKNTITEAIHEVDKLIKEVSNV
ncbi:hypothetical protein SHAb15599_00094 [Acinetobacter phage SH-Ab 15599]|nr:hypothetical protein SHAb15599_00094 [Acinetobacter phage SH-Ab 15599]